MDPLWDWVKGGGAFPLTFMLTPVPSSPPDPPYVGIVAPIKNYVRSACSILESPRRVFLQRSALDRNNSNCTAPEDEDMIAVVASDTENQLLFQQRSQVIQIDVPVLHESGEYYVLCRGTYRWGVGFDKQEVRLLRMSRRFFVD